MNSGIRRDGERTIVPMTFGQLIASKVVVNKLEVYRRIALYSCYSYKIKMPDPLLETVF